MYTIKEIHVMMSTEDGRKRQTLKKKAKAREAWHRPSGRTPARFSHWSRSCVTCRCGEREELLYWRELNQTKVQANPSLTVKLANTNPNSHPKFQIKIPLRSGCTVAAQRANQETSSEFPLVQRKVSQCVWVSSLEEEEWMAMTPACEGGAASVQRRSVLLPRPPLLLRPPSVFLCPRKRPHLRPREAAQLERTKEDP